MFSTIQQSKIEVRPMPLPDLLSNMAQGNLQIPRFQREFVWPLSKTRALLDSMYKQFPIGTLFFWQAPPEQSDIFRELKELQIPTPHTNQAVSYILDGQQRLTSLFAVGNGLKLEKGDYSKICLDIEAAYEYDNKEDNEFERDIFITRRAPDNIRYVPFFEILSSNLNFTLYNGLSDKGKKIFEKTRQRFATYPFSIVWVREQPLDEVVEIFQRINQGGKRLSSYDLVCANLWTEDFNFRRKVELLNQELSESGFGKIDEKLFPQAIALILSGKSSQSAQLRLKSESVSAIWLDIRRAILRAIDFAQNNVGVKRAEFFPYSGILSVLIFFFYHLEGAPLLAEQRAVLWKWFWGTSASEHYGTSSGEKINSDANRFKLFLEGKGINWPKYDLVKPQDFEKVNMKLKTSALRNTLLSLLAIQQPHNFKDGSPIDLKQDFFSTLSRAERHHIFPVDFLKQQQVSVKDVHLAPNFAFIPGDLNREISDKAPSIYMTQYQGENPNFIKDISSHLIPIGQKSPIWADNYEKFLQARSQLLVEQLNKLFNDGPNIVNIEVNTLPDEEGYGIISNIELQLRTLIDSQLQAVAGGMYWTNTVSDKINNKVNQKIGQHITAHPFLNPADYASGKKKLDFCDIGDYISIIKQNWPQFKNILGNQDVCLRHLNDFRVYRNLIAHNNQQELTDVVRKNAEAAIIWIQSTIESHVLNEEILEG